VLLLARRPVAGTHDADHDRIESRYLDGILYPTGGTVHIGLDASGHGMRFKSADAERFRVS
jgi:hypothetical protein